MSNFEKWKTARAAFYATEDAYNAAHNSVIDAGEKRAAAWDALTIAARTLSPDERKQAAEFEFGSALPLQP